MSTKKLSELPLGTIAYNVGVDVNGNAVQEAASSSSYKKIVMLLNQSGTNAPSAKILENTIGIEPSFSRIGLGEYNITMLGAFPDPNKVAVFTGSTLQLNVDFGGNITTPTTVSQYNDVNSLYIVTFLQGQQFSDNRLLNLEIEIRVYN